MLRQLLLGISLLSVSSFAGDLKNQHINARQEAKQNIDHFIGYSDLDLSASLKKYGTFVVDADKSVNYVIYYKIADAGIVSLIAEHAGEASELFFTLAKARGLNTKSCKPVDHLQFFVISRSELNSKKVTRTIEIQDNDYLVGLFDPIVEKPRTANIFLTNQAFEKFNIEIISHEISHYWFYRLCWKNNELDVDDEVHALVFGSYYSQVHAKKGTSKKND